MCDYQDLLDVVMDTLPDGHPWEGNVKMLVENLIANGVTLQKWIPVTERLPKPLTQVLSYGHGCFEVNMVDGGVWDSEYYSEYSVTHWMPLPDPPKGE